MDEVDRDSFDEFGGRAVEDAEESLVEARFVV